MISKNNLLNRSWIFLIILTWGAWFCAPSHARLLQIIHTNDLHSFFEHGEEDTIGGFAAVKFQIDRLKSEAEAQGIDTLVLDAGDFSEGTPFFFADNGLDSWAMMEAMGFEAVVLGNHDWLIGLELMDDLLGRLRPTMPFLSANFPFIDKGNGIVYYTRYKNIVRHIFPYFEFVRAGQKIAVLGLSTDNMLYRWRIQNGVLETPRKTANEFLPRLKKENDFVIALTHLGVEDDKKLVRNTSGIDLVVGGHSHTALFQPHLEKDLDKKIVPIVQAGAHGHFVGDLLVDLERGKPLQILRYRLLPVAASSDQEKDEAITNRVADSRKHLEEAFGPERLYEPIVFSTIPLERPQNRATWWGNLFADTLKEEVEADFSIDTGEFFGPTQAGGIVTLEKLMHFYPRLFDFDLPFGWTIWELDVPGALLEDLLAEFGGADGPAVNLVLSGVRFTPSGEIWVGDERLDQGKRYKVATTEGIGRGAQDYSRLLKKYLRPRDTGIPILTAVERKLRRLGLIVGPEPSGIASVQDE